MATDIVVQTTIEFIRSSPENVQVALSVEKTMPVLRMTVYGKVMGGVLGLLKRNKGRWQLEEHYPGKRIKGESHQIHRIRLYQKTGWTSKDKHGGVWFAHWDGRFRVGVEGIQNESEATVEAVASIFGQFLDDGDDCAVQRDDPNWMGWKGLAEETLFAMPDTGDGSLEEFATRVAHQMLALTEAISRTRQPTTSTLT